MELKAVKVEIPEGTNVIIGATHFIKTIEDLYEIMVSTAPGAKFAIAFCEASGPCLVRVEGNDEGLRKNAADNALEIGAGHTFIIVLKGAFPVSVLNSIKACPEVCSIYAATANPLELIIAVTAQGRGVMGVVDGFAPKGVEGDEDVKQRKMLLRKLGYKL